ncbi:MAG: adenylyltransferase/cytidyltransferase family protein, partial [Candidatus Levybacteria bacterium]|nr:adenylyltransferase/cytidyltransferase family protein [Candidatus Levybacteria bacterium]
MKFHHVIVGGTFDHFHRGHQKLLTQSFKVGEKITVGISLPQLYQNKKHTLSVEGYSIREQYVTDFVN